MEAVSGIADLVGPVLGALTMATHIWIPFLIATVAFSLMFTPALYLNNTVKEGTVPQGDPSSAAETQPLLGNDITSDSEADDRVPRPEELLRSKAAILLLSFGSFFLFQVARDSTNYLIPWVALRFNETMARVCTRLSTKST